MGPLRRLTFDSIAKFSRRWRPLTQNQQRVNWVSQKKIKEISEQHYQRRLNEAVRAFEETKC